ncbi:MAG: hypothetical protein H0V96_04425, partial [Acidimicrobiia bacterium]|nr:hypothetical protein [Acidimicrobiia bacterium]
MPPEVITRLVGKARRRLTAMFLVRRLVAAIGVVAGAGALLLGIGRRVVLPWSEPAVLVAGALAVAAVTVWTAASRPSPRRAAIELDTRLGAKDQVATALELAGHLPMNVLEHAQVTKAAAWAEGRTLAGFGAVLPATRLLGLAGLAVVAALALAIPESPADAEQQRRQADDALIADAIDDLRQAAAEATDEEVAATLEDAAEDLEEAANLDEAIARLGDTRADLAELADPDALPLRAAMAGT